MSNPFESLRGRRGQVHPCCQTTEERQKATKLAKLREANKKLKTFAEGKATEAAKATELYDNELSYIHAAVAEMSFHSPQQPIHEQVQGQVVSVRAVQNQPHNPQQLTHEEEQVQAVSAGATQNDNPSTPKKANGTMSVVEAHTPDKLQFLLSEALGSQRGGPFSSASLVFRRPTSK